MLSHSSPPAEEPALTTTPLRPGRRGHAGRGARPEPGVGAPDRRRLISNKANSVADRASSYPAPGRFAASSFALRAYWPEWRSPGTSGLVTGITVTR